MMTPEEFIKACQNPNNTDLSKEAKPIDPEDHILVPIETLQFVKDALGSVLAQDHSQLYPSVVAGVDQAIRRLKPYLD